MKILYHGCKSFRKAGIKGENCGLDLKLYNFIRTFSGFVSIYGGRFSLGFVGTTFLKFWAKKKLFREIEDKKK